MEDVCAVTPKQRSWVVIAVLQCYYCRAVWLDAIHSYYPPEMWKPDTYQCWACILKFPDLKKAVELLKRNRENAMTSLVSRSTLVH